MLHLVRSDLKVEKEEGSLIDSLLADSHKLKGKLNRKVRSKIKFFESQFSISL